MKSEFQRIAAMARSRTGTSLMSKIPKRAFNKNFDRNLNNLLNKIPNGNVGIPIIALNTLIYGLYCIWPRHNQFAFMNNFTFSMYGLNKGYLHNMFTCHFTHTSFFSYAIDSVIMYLLCQNLGMQFSNLFVAKVCLLSIACGSGLMFLHHASQNVNRAYFGNDSILRGLIFTVIFSNPQAQLMLFPLPF